MHVKFIQMCGEKKLSKKVYLMEDDYYILRPIKFLPNYSYGTMADALERRGILFNDNWAAGMRYTKQLLEKNGVKTPINYESHIPKVIDRAKAPLWLDEGVPMRWHSAYLNLVRSRESRNMAFDVKASQNKGLVDLLKLNTTFLSSLDETFTAAHVEEALSLILPEKSRYER